MLSLGASRGRLWSSGPAKKIAKAPQKTNSLPTKRSFHTSKAITNIRPNYYKPRDSQMPHDFTPWLQEFDHSYKPEPKPPRFENTTFPPLNFEPGSFPMVKEPETEYYEKSFVLRDTPTSMTNMIYPKPIVKQLTFDKDEVYETGSRKAARAMVRLKRGDGNIMVNGKHWLFHFKEIRYRAKILQPLVLSESLFRWDVFITVQGGGFSGQIGAVHLALCKAIVAWDPEYKYMFKRFGYLTRDPREVERKKTGQRKARRGFQWVKR